jgi:N-acyl-L-homoserine lactone synthetase
VCIDDDPERLAETYRLRYQAYCVERAFLGASGYPDGLETDEFDLFSRHFATIDADGRIVATLRFVYPSVVGLPLFRHCTLFPGETALYDSRNSVAEISRLSVSRPHRPSAFGNGALFSLYRAVYHDAKRTGMTHWAIATEASLYRTLTASGFPFRQIGPEIDYWGLVAPYVLELAELDRILIAGTAPRLDGFLDGLEAPYRPGSHETKPFAPSMPPDICST